MKIKKRQQEFLYLCKINLKFFSLYEIRAGFGGCGSAPGTARSATYLVGGFPLPCGPTVSVLPAFQCLVSGGCAEGTFMRRALCAWLLVWSRGEEETKERTRISAPPLCALPLLRLFHPSYLLCAALSPRIQHTPHKTRNPPYCHLDLSRSRQVFLSFFLGLSSLLICAAAGRVTTSPPQQPQPKSPINYLFSFNLIKIK